MLRLRKQKGKLRADPYLNHYWYHILNLSGDFIGEIILVEEEDVSIKDIFTELILCSYINILKSFLKNDCKWEVVDAED